MQNIIQLQNVSFRYDQSIILNNLNLSIQKGSIYGFLGPNGAGKTTTLKLILGLLSKSEGEIYVFENNKYTKDIRYKIGNLIENPSIYLHLTGKENLEIYRLIYNLDKKRVNEVLEVVGLSNDANKITLKYSHGMKQRLGIGIALIHNPEVIILDEPTNGLDPHGISDIRNLILKLNSEFNKTILLSSHILDEIEKIATVVGIIDKGTLLFEGTMGELHSLRSSNTVLEIEVENPYNVYELLKESYSISIKNNNTLKIENLSKDQIAAINFYLSNNKIKVYRLEIVKSSLESLFFETLSKN